MSLVVAALLTVAFLWLSPPATASNKPSAAGNASGARGSAPGVRSRTGPGTSSAAANGMQSDESVEMTRLLALLLGLLVVTVLLPVQLAKYVARRRERPKEARVIPLFPARRSRRRGT